MGIQFGAQQYGTTPPSAFGTSNDQLGLIGRVGWAKDQLSIDAFMTRVGQHRGSILGLEQGDVILPLDATRTDSYFRVGYGDPDTSRAWAQVLAVGSKYNYTGIRTAPTENLRTAAESALAVTSLDSGVFRPQYVATVGTVRGPLRLSGGARLFGAGGKAVFSPEVRAAFAARLLTVSAFSEGESIDSTARSDITVRFSPLPFVSLLGGAGRTSQKFPRPVSPLLPGTEDFSTNYVRGELGLRVYNLWLLGGVIRRDSVRLSPPRTFDTTFVAATELAATGTTGAIRGQLWRLLNLDVWGVKWNDAGFYRPQYQTRSELFVKTNMLDRFPSGDLGISASIVHEYRSSMLYPTLRGGVLRSSGYRTFSTLLEIRVLNATVMWQFRNFLGERYSLVPSFIMPRQTNYYGVRWYFVD
jgi:hypothetical protein